MASAEASTAEPSSTHAELVKKFQILDSVGNVLSMILEGGDATAVSSSVAKLHARFAECEELLKNLPGGDMSKQQQKQRIEELTAKIAKQKALVAKYKNLDVLLRIAGQPNAQSAPPSAGLTDQSAGDVDFSGQITPSSATGGLLGDEDLFFAQK